MHESNTFSVLPMHYENPLQTLAKKNPQNLPFSLGMWTPSNTPIPGLTLLTTTNSSLIASRTFTQLRNKVSTGYNGTPHIHPKIAPSHGAISSPVYLPHPWTEPTHHDHPKRHPDTISRFPQYIGQTDRPTDRQMG